MPKDTGEFIISKSMNLRLPPIFGYTAFLFIPRQVRFSQSLSHIVNTLLLWICFRFNNNYFNVECFFFSITFELLQGRMIWEIEIRTTSLHVIGGEQRFTAYLWSNICGKIGFM